MDEPRDIADVLEVPEDQRLDADDYPDGEVNADEFADLSGVPDGQVVELSTASLDDGEDYEECSEFGSHPRGAHQEFVRQASRDRGN